MGLSDWPRSKIHLSFNLLRVEYRKFGSTDFEVSALGLGCMRLPTVRIIPQRVDNRKATSMIRSAVDQGVNYLDTAWPYHFGGSEKVLGNALKDGYREKVHLVTKLFMPLVRKPEDFDSFLERQLNKLQTDYLDTYLFHSLNKSYFDKVKRFDLIERMIRAREDGKIRYIGFSFHDVLPVYKEIVDYYNWDVTQIQYNYMDTAIQATHEGLTYAASKGMAVVVMEPVKGGQLANPPQEAREVMSKAENQRSAVDWALQYLWNLPEVSLVLSGMSSRKQLDENVESAGRSGINALSPEDNAIIQQLVGIYRKKILVPCTACQYCMNCPSGVNIPENFAIINNMAMENGFGRFRTKRSYRKLVSEEKKLNKEKTNGNAAVCTDCKICIQKCPQGIDIPEELRKVDLVMNQGKKLSEIYRLD